MTLATEYMVGEVFCTCTYSVYSIPCLSYATHAASSCFKRKTDGIFSPCNCHAMKIKSQLSSQKRKRCRGMIYRPTYIRTVPNAMLSFRYRSEREKRRP